MAALPSVLMTGRRRSRGEFRDHGGTALMLHVPVPHGDDLHLEHLALDVNGTLADRGEPIPETLEVLARIGRELRLHVLTADTFGTGAKLASRLGAEFRRVTSGEEKLDYLERLGAETCVALGNGRNDALMLTAAGLGIAVLGPEGTHSAAVAAADVVARSVLEALQFLDDPRVLTATMRP
jgi:soluble P-type ATPase